MNNTLGVITQVRMPLPGTRTRVITPMAVFCCPNIILSLEVFILSSIEPPMDDELRA